MSDMWPPPNDPAQPDRAGQPPYSQGPDAPQGRPVYPQQELLPQEVKPGRSRLPLVIGLVVVFALIAGGVVTWLLLRNTGEDTRAQYCSALRTLTNNGDVTSAIGSADASTAEVLQQVLDTAPTAVKPDWQTLRDLGNTASTSPDNVDISSALKAYSAYQSIARDARDNCNLTINLPGL